MAAEPPVECPMHAKQASVSSASSCPVVSKEEHVPINPETMMPYPEDLHTASVDLSRDRTESSIPRTGATEGGSWVYPSPLMFYSALQRKGYVTPVEHIDMMVAIHNQLNEDVWQEVLKWERHHASSCRSGPTLYQFRGRPSELSPKARLYTWFGVPPPFDRHDWIIDRCGKRVRYIIDYYSGHPEPDGTPTIHADVRPDLYSFGNIWDRIRMTFHDLFN